MTRFDFTRRDFLKAAGIWAGAGILQPVWSLIGAGKTIEAAYPDEVLSIEQYTKGQVKPGMIITKENAALIKDIAPEGLMVELQRGNTEVKIGETTLDPKEILPGYWVEATLRHKGQAVLDSKGQLWHKDGGPWVGGAPFPEPKSGLEAIWNYTFDPIRFDDFYLLGIEYYVDTNGNVVRYNLTHYIHIQASGRLVVEPKPFLPDYKDEMYRTVLAFENPFDVQGLQIATTTYYDNSRLPDTDSYIPALRRTRRLPSSQRFEPAAPYSAFFISDLALHGDPVLTWSWTLAGRKPMLMPSPRNTGMFDPNPDPYTFVESPAKFPKMIWELRPEMFLVDGVPHLEGANYSKKRMYVDGITGLVESADVWDLAGKLWKFMTFPVANRSVPDGAGGTARSSCGIVFADLQKDYHSCVYFPAKRGNEAWRCNTGLKIDDWITPLAMLKRSRR